MALLRACVWSSLIIGIVGLIPLARAQSLWEAAGAGDVAAMDRQRAAGESLTVPNEQGLCPIQVAATYGSIEAAKWLLDRGVEVNTRTRRDSPLSLACANGHAELASELLKRGGKYHVRDDGLRQAALAGHSECVQLLLEQGVQLGPVTTRELMEGVLKAGHVETLILLRRAERKWRKLGDNPLQEREEKLLRAAYVGDVGQARALAGPDISDFGLLAALTLARQQGQLDVIDTMRVPAAKALAEAEHRRNLGASGPPVQTSSGVRWYMSSGTALWSLIGQGKLEEVRSRLEAGVDVESRWLTDAVKTDKPEMVALILDYGVNINERYSEEKQTVLFQAAEKGKSDLVKLLLERGADPEVPDVDGVTPLQIAQRNQHADVVELLRKHRGASANGR